MSNENETLPCLQELQLSDTEHDSNDHLYDSLNEAEITGDSKTNNAKLNASNNSSAEMSTKERVQNAPHIIINWSKNLNFFYRTFC